MKIFINKSHTQSEHASTLNIKIGTFDAIVTRSIKDMQSGMIILPVYNPYHAG